MIRLSHAVKADAAALNEVFFLALQQKPVDNHYKIATRFQPRKPMPNPLLHNPSGPPGDFIDHHQCQMLRMLIQAKQSGQYVVIAEDKDDKKIRGYVRYGATGDKGVVGEIYALGAGGKLLQQAVRHLADLNVCEITAVVPNGVTTFFEKNGFKRQNRLLDPWYNEMKASLKHA